MNTLNFLQSVLGYDGSLALKKACERAPVLEPVLVPRTVVSWLQTITRIGYEGSVPGLDNSYLVLNKNEHDNVDGTIALDGVVYNFKNSNILHVAAAIGVALGIDSTPIDPMLKGQDLSKLGKSIDLLVKAKIVSQELGNDLEKKVLDPSLGYKISHEHVQVNPGQMMTKISAHSPSGDLVGSASFVHTPKGIKAGHVVVEEEHQRKGLASAMYSHAQSVTNKPIVPSENQTDEGAALWSGNKLNPQFNKEEMHGQAAAPREPNKPVPPSKQPAQPKKKGFPLTKNTSSLSCPDCGGKYFSDDKLVGCICVRDLVKSTGAEYLDGYLKFKNIDEESYSMFLRILGD